MNNKNIVVFTIIMILCVNVYQKLLIYSFRYIPMHLVDDLITKSHYSYVKKTAINKLN